MANIGAPPIPRLDLVDYVGQRSSTFLFSLSDGLTGELKGALTPLRGQTPTLTHNTTSTIKRTVTLSLGVEDTTRIDPVRDRVNIYWLNNGTVYPLGKYLFVDQTNALWTSGELASVSLMDEMFIIDQPMERGFGGGQVIVDAIRSLLADFPTFEVAIETSGLNAAGSWNAGTSRANVLVDLCTQGGFFRPWFNHHGILTIIKSFDPADKEPSIDLDEGNRVIRGSISQSEDLLTAANRFVVIGNGYNGDSTSSPPAVGTYDIPGSAPHSIANRGFVVPDVRDIQVTSIDQARTMARTIGIASTIFQTVTLNTPPDPRHDSYDVIRWQGQRWLELGWSMALVEGGTMSHTMRRAYT